MKTLRLLTIFTVSFGSVVVAMPNLYWWHHPLNSVALIISALLCYVAGRVEK